MLVAATPSVCVVVSFRQFTDLICFVYENRFLMISVLEGRERQLCNPLLPTLAPLVPHPPQKKQIVSFR